MLKTSSIHLERNMWNNQRIRFREIKPTKQEDQEREIPQMTNKNMLITTISLALWLLVNVLFAFILPNPNHQELLSWVMSNGFLLLGMISIWIFSRNEAAVKTVPIALTNASIVLCEFILSLILIGAKADMRTTIFMEVTMFLIYILSVGIAVFATTGTRIERQAKTNNMPIHIVEAKPLPRNPRLR
jgi:hypothetical protein